MRNFKRQNGFTVIEAMIVLFVSILAASAAAKIYGQYTQAQRTKIAADHAGVIVKAGTSYIQDNYAAITSVASPTAPAVITTAMLKSTGYLSTSVSDQNIYGQSYQILALEPTANKLQILIVTTGGETIKDMPLRRTAQNIGGKGGYISAMNTSTAMGSYGAWQMPLSSYGVSPGAGHLAIALFFDDGSLSNDYLNRSAIAGHPEVNRMNTAIDLNGNNLNNVATIGAVTANIAGTATAQTADVKGETYTGGWFRGRGDGLIYSEKWGGGFYQNDPDWVRIYNDKGLATSGRLVSGGVVTFGDQIATGTVTAQKRLSTDEYLSVGGTGEVGQWCGDNKLFAKTARGGILECIDGIWQNPSGGGQYVLRVYRNNDNSSGAMVPEWGCQPNFKTGDCSCPYGYADISYLTGQSYYKKEWDSYYFTHFCMNQIK